MSRSIGDDGTVTVVLPGSSKHRKATTLVAGTDGSIKIVRGSAIIHFDLIEVGRLIGTLAAERGHYKTATRIRDLTESPRP